MIAASARAWSPSEVSVPSSSVALPIALKTRLAPKKSTSVHRRVWRSMRAAILVGAQPVQGDPVVAGRGAARHAPQPLRDREELVGARAPRVGDPRLALRREQPRQQPEQRLDVLAGV